MTANPHHRETTTIALSGATAVQWPSPRTFICMGAARGGTSMVAGAMHAVGIHMGDNLSDTHEDPCFAGKGVPAMTQELARRYERGLSHWGWKFPNAANYLDRLRPHLRNPHLVIVSRDLVATAKGHMRWHGRNEMQALTDILLSTQRNIFLALSWQVPTLLVSYEKAMAFPENFISELCAFADLTEPVDRAAIIAFMAPGSYKLAPPKDEPRGPAE